MKPFSMENKKIVLQFRADDRDIFNAIVTGKKTIETRAGSKRYRGIRVGDTTLLLCGKKKIEKKIADVKLFKSIDALLKCYTPESINPAIHTREGMEEMWYSFPGYKEKIKKYGLVALTLK